MKDKLVSIAPFIVIVALVLAWIFFQGRFSPKTAPGASTGPATAAAQPEIPPPPPPAPWPTYHGDQSLAGIAAATVTLPDKPNRRWRFQVKAPILWGPVSSDKYLHFVTSQGEVVTVDFEGHKIWSKQLTRTTINDNAEQPARVEGPVSCFQNTLFLGTMAGVVYAFDAATGDIKWERDIDNAILGAVTYQPASATRPQGRVYVIGQDDGSLHCLSFDDGTPLWKSEEIDRCDGSPAAGDGIITFGSCASALHVINADDGTIMKNVPVGEESQVAGGVAVLGSSVFSGSHSGYLIHADLAAGEVRWTNEDSETEIFTTPAVSAGRVVFGSMDDFVYCLDRDTGKQIWKFDSKGTPTSPVIVGDRVVVGSDGVLFILSLDTGDVLWSFEVSDEITAPSIIHNMILVGGKDGSLSAFGA